MEGIGEVEEEGSKREGGKAGGEVGEVEALLIKGSSAFISSPPKGSEESGMLLYKFIAVAMTLRFYK